MQHFSSKVKQCQYLIENDLTDSDKYHQLYQQLKTINSETNPTTQNSVETEEMVSDKQAFQIKQQILAYKYLVRNMPIPRDVEKNLTNLTKEQWEIESERIMSRSLRFYSEKIEKNEELKKLINEKMNKKLNETKESDMPLAQSIIDKKQSYIDKRKQEITNLLQTDLLTQETKQKLVCELKFLNLFDLYQRLRKQIIRPQEQFKSNNRILERNLLDRSFYKKDKPPKRIEGKSFEKIEVQIKIEQEKRKRLKHKDFLSTLFSHQTEFFEFHKKIKKHCKKRANQSRIYLDTLEKRKLEQKTKERVQLLKLNDLEAYMKLVEEAKNTRIVEILKQTDSFLRQLGAKVIQQKGEGVEEIIDEDLNFGEKTENHFENLKRSNKVYYNLTHTKKEQIIGQPGLLEGGTLKNYQLAGLQWLVSLYNNRLNGILADEMGLGKTIQTISLFCYLMEVKKNYGPFLVVVPLSTLSNWCLEFDKWAPTIKKICYKGSPNVRKDLAKQLKTTKWNVCLTTYDYILKDRLTLHKYEWKYIVVDEGHRMKNARSKFAQVLGQQYTSEMRVLLTGTPLQNNLGELWSLLNFLLPKVFSSCDDFEKWFSMPLGRLGSNEKESALTEEENLLIINRLHQVLTPFLLRRVKKEVESELPNKVEYVIKVELSSWQKIVYNHVNKKSMKSEEEQQQYQGKIGNKALMNLMMQMRKICNHPYLFLSPDQYEINDNIWRVSGKFELLDRILPKLISRGHRILIFSQMTQLMNIMQEYFDFKGIKHLRLDGGTKEDDRGERMQMFNAVGSEYDVFMLSTRAGGLGLNLQTADTVIIFDSDWNPQMDLQAQDRAHRIGQKNEVRVLRLVTNTWIEEEILSKAAYKINLDEMIIQAGLYNQRSTDYERRQKIEDLLKRKHVYEELDEEIPNDEQINEMIARSEDEFDYFTRLDKLRYEEDRQSYTNFVYPSKEDGKSFNYRLGGDDLVPECIKNPPKIQQDDKEYGRGNRTRKNVNYSDELAEIFFDKIIQEEEDNALKKFNRKRKSQNPAEDVTFSETSEEPKLKEESYKKIRLSLNQELNEIEEESKEFQSSEDQDNEK